MAVPVLALAYYLAASNIESGKERCRAVSQIIMRITFQIAKSHGKRWLTALKGLTLAFFVHTEDQRIGRRVQVKTHDVSNLFDEERVCRKLETSTPVRFDPKGTPDPLDSGLRYSGFRGKVPARPMGALRRFGVDGLFEQLCNVLVRNAPGSPRPQFIMQPLNTLLDKSLAPLPNSGLGYFHLFCDGFAVYSLGSQAKSTICIRAAMPCGMDRAFAQDSSCSRCSFDILSSILGRPVRIFLPLLCVSIELEGKSIPQAHKLCNLLMGRNTSRVLKNTC